MGSSTPAGNIGSADFTTTSFAAGFPTRLARKGHAFVEG